MDRVELRRDGLFIRNRRSSTRDASKDRGSVWSDTAPSKRRNVAHCLDGDCALLKHLPCNGDGVGLAQIWFTSGNLPSSWAEAVNQQHLQTTMIRLAKNDPLDNERIDRRRSGRKLWQPSEQGLRYSSCSYDELPTTKFQARDGRERQQQSNSHLRKVREEARPIPRHLDIAGGTDRRVEPSQTSPKSYSVARGPST
jgi:hypothetical protein